MSSRVDTDTDTGTDTHITDKHNFKKLVAHHTTGLKFLPKTHRKDVAEV